MESVPKLMRIAGSPPGLQFEVEIKPNTFIKQQRREDRSIDSEIIDLRDSFWRKFNQALQAQDAQIGCRLRYGGRLGFQWILPDVSAEWMADEPHVLVFVQAGKGRQGTGVVLECRKGAKPEAEERLERAREALRAQGVVLGNTPADLSEAAAADAAIGALLGRLKPALEELGRAFAQSPAALVSSR